MPFDNEQPAVSDLPIAAIRVEGRFRRELGDIASLADSIAEVGLLHPIVVTPDHRLIAGARRLHAMRKLGRTHVPAHVVPLADILRGEFDENAVRADFLPSEFVAIKRNAPRRRWLLVRSLLRGNLTVKVAPPGVGKSTLCLERAVAVVTGRTITGEEVHEQAKAWVYNNEDDGDELKRRLAAVLQHWNIPLDEVKGRLALNSGADRPLLVAKANRAGTVIRLPDIDACIEHIRAHGIGLFIVDPFIETHEVNENSNEQIKAVAAMFREIARRGECAVMLVHHTAKPPQGRSDGHAGDLQHVTWASALTGVARVVQTLF